MNKNEIIDQKLQTAIDRIKQINEYDNSRGTKRVLNEYTFNTGAMNEEGDDDQNQQQNPQGGMNNDQSGQASQGGMNNQDSMIPNSNQPGGAPQGGGMPGGDMSGGIPQDGGMPGGAPQDDMGGQDPMGGSPENGGDTITDDDINTPDDEDEDNKEDDENDDKDEEEDEEVIDVDELVDGQNTTQYKVDNIDSKMKDLLNVVSKVAKAIEINTKKVKEFKTDVENELKHRMPNDQEKINIRTLASKPYNMTPNDYWEEQAKTNPYYKIVANNDVPPQDEEEYILKQSDLDSINDYEIDKTIDNLPDSLLDYFK